MKDIQEAVEYTLRKTVTLILEADTLGRKTPNGNTIMVPKKVREIALAKADLLCFLLVDAFGWGESSTAFGMAGVIREEMYPTTKEHAASRSAWRPTQNEVEAVQVVDVVERLVRKEAQRMVREGVKR